MSTEQNDIVDALSHAATNVVEELVEFRRGTWVWVEQPHKLKDIKARQKQLQAIGDELSTISIALLRQKNAGVPGNEIDANLRIVEIARGYESEIRDFLAIDYDALKKKGSDIDLVKNMTFIFGLPAAFVAGAKNGIGDGHINVNEALVFGFAISVPTVFHKRIVSAFTKTRKAIGSVPHVVQTIPAQIGGDLRVVYVRETAKDKAKETRACLTVAAKSINDNVRAGKRQTAFLMKRVFRRHGPGF